MNIFKGLIASMLCLALIAVGGCNTTGIDAQVQKSLPVVCKQATDAKPVIELLIASGKIKGKTQTAVTAAYSTLDGICVDPSKETAASILTSALTAYLIISSAMKTAQATE